MRPISRLLLCLLLIPLGCGFAQEYKYEVGFATGATGYLGDLNPKIPFASPGVGAAVQARYNINFRAMGYLALSYNFFQGKNLATGSDFVEGRDVRFATSSLLLNPAFEYNFYPYSDKYPFLGTRRITPYISLGLVAGIGLGDRGSAFFIPGLSGGFGLKYKVANKWNLQLQLGGMHFFTDKLDTGGSSSPRHLNNPYQLAYQPWKGNDGAVMLQFGVTYEFGVREKDCHAL